MNNEADQKLANVSVSNVSMYLLIMKAPESLQNGLCFQFLESLYILVLRKERFSHHIVTRFGLER